jgi:FtsP/CotA-like multicopper oxidase with cupredoxin domain
MGCSSAQKNKYLEPLALTSTKRRKQIMAINRRDFLKFAGGGIAVLVVGSKMPWLTENKAYAAFPVPLLDFTITDTIKEMVTYNAINTNAECYFWVYKEANLPADCPGPTIYATAGDTINIRITNALDEPHSFVIPGIFNSGAIAPGAFVQTSLTIPLNMAGTHLYFDNLNAPVNRVMGLHGALIVMPATAAVPPGPTPTPTPRPRSASSLNQGNNMVVASLRPTPTPTPTPPPGGSNRITPYSNPTPQVQLLFNELGSAGHWPGLAWDEGNPDTKTPPFRQYVWLLHQASPTLFRDVGSLGPGQIFSAAEFVERFTNDAFSANNHDLDTASDIPQYFTSGGQSGHFCHNNPTQVPMCRVGEPVVIRVLNAGLMTHSMHIHANHFYILSVDGVVQGNPNPADPTLTGPGLIWVDTFTANPWGTPSHRYDLLLPFMRPPDVPNVRGIGLGGAPDAALPTVNLNGAPTGSFTWPPVQEFDVAMGKTIPVRQSPLCYPAHDHSEPSQTAQGGNYNCGVIGGQYFIGDLNINLPRFPNPFLGGDLPPQTFPMDEDFAMMIFRSDGTIVYGMDGAREHGIGECSRDDELESQDDRDEFPPLPPPV